MPGRSGGENGSHASNNWRRLSWQAVPPSIRSPAPATIAMSQAFAGFRIASPPRKRTTWGRVMSERPDAHMDAAGTAAADERAAPDCETDPTAIAAADARAREDATDPTLSILLQAPAGSGKTTVL